MTPLEKWQDDNNRYLAAAISWLRSLLQERCEASASAASTGLSGTEPRPGWWRFSRGEAGKPPILLPAAGSANRKTSAEQGAALAALAAEMNPPPALVLLAKRLSLSAFEQNVLMLCVSMELDTGLASLCALAQREPACIHPTFGLALTLFEDPSWDSLSPEGGLRSWRLIEIHQSAGQPLITSSLQADERIVNYVKGVSYLDDRLTPLLSRLSIELTMDDAPPSQRAQAEAITEMLKGATNGKLPVVQLPGCDPVSKQLIAGWVCASLNLKAYRLPANLIPLAAAERDSLARLWQRESMLLPLALYVDASAIEPESASGMQGAIDGFLDRMAGPVFFDTRESWAGLSRASVPFEVLKPTPLEQQAAWSSALGPEAAGEAAMLAGQFDLNAVDIARIAFAAKGAPGDASLSAKLWDGCLAQTRPRLGGMAQRIEPKATWDDLVLPQMELQLLHQLADQVAQRGKVYDDWGFRAKMNRGLGIGALFSGPSGTGKTLAAEVLANALRLNLFRIDLSAIVSKYIGETEKNLRRMFDAAEDGGAILFFDEADALFGKRSEVKDSHDRYANIEVNYLLQRMEAYRGLAILATNMKSALDPAFLRRLRFVVTFPFPSSAERKVIWQHAFPAQTPVSGLDFDRLSKLAVTGGNIHGIAINAAFAAAQSGSPVTMPIVLDAARAEFRKLAKPINEADFRWAEAAGAVA